jgi:hypothetical protein
LNIAGALRNNLDLDLDLDPLTIVAPLSRALRSE